MSDWRSLVGKFRYGHSPLAEALCEFGFTPSPDWTPELVSSLEGVFKSDYPQRKDLKTIQAQVAINEQGVQQGLLQGERIQFVREDGAAMVQIAPNTLTVNNLKPYAGWDQFKPNIINSLKTYIDVAQPNGIFRAHLRYINRIELAGNSIDLDDWFEFSFRQPKMQDLPGAATYIVGAQYPFDEHSLLRVEIANAPGADNILASVLDLEYTLVGENVLQIDAVEAWLELAHNRVEAAWLGSVTEKLHLKYHPESVV